MQTDEYSAKVISMKGNRLIVDINEEINVERLRTIFRDHKGDREVEIRFTDPRKFAKEQRYFVFALINDISDYTGQPHEYLKEMFYFVYEQITGREISLKDTSNATKNDAYVLTNIILDFIFEWDIPFKKGYEILPNHQEYYFYKCVLNRVCCICGKKADIDHFDRALGRRSRKLVDHTEYNFAALCRIHHQEKHKVGITTFKDKYKIKGIKLKQEEIERLRIDN